MRYSLILLLLLCNIFSFAQKKKTAVDFIRPLPVPHQTVNDFSKFLSLSEKQWLEKEQVDYYRRTGNALVFISLESLTDPKTKKEYTIEEAALLYFNKWGIGDKIKNNGVVLMVSRNPRGVRIQVGTGLEAILTNETCQQIVDNNLVPNFKQGLFFTGIKEAVEKIEERLDNPPTAVPRNASGSIESISGTTSSSYKESPLTGFAIIALVIGFPALIILFARAQARRQGGWFNSGGYSRRPYFRNSFNNYNNNNIYSGGGDSNRWSSGGGNSSSSSSSLGGSSYSGGSSSGGGASGSW